MCNKICSIRLDLCGVLHMATNLAIDDELLKKAQKIGKKLTKKATVTEALEEYIARRKRQQLLDAFGSIDFHKDYDYKSERKKR